tara:strand:+ start:388 stop:516 length:129 start_codon:yes stop_codon:yes gene_type:complete
MIKDYNKKTSNIELRFLSERKKIKPHLLENIDKALVLLIKND